jgi:hypothetical protein
VTDEELKRFDYARLMAAAMLHALQTQYPHALTALGAAGAVQATRDAVQDVFDTVNGAHTFPAPQVLASEARLRLEQPDEFYRYQVRLKKSLAELRRSR